MLKKKTKSHTSEKSYLTDPYKPWLKIFLTISLWGRAKYQEDKSQGKTAESGNVALNIHIHLIDQPIIIKKSLFITNKSVYFTTLIIMLIIN